MLLQLASAAVASEPPCWPGTLPGTVCHKRLSQALRNGIDRIWAVLAWVLFAGASVK